MKILSYPRPDLLGHAHGDARVFDLDGDLDLHPKGLHRWNEFADRIPFSRETWRQRIHVGEDGLPLPLQRIMKHHGRPYRTQAFKSWSHCGLYPDVTGFRSRACTIFALRLSAARQ